MDRDERDRLIASKYQGDAENPPVSAEQLTRDFSLSLSTIRKILTTHGVLRKDQPNTPGVPKKVKGETKPISPGHMRIGLKLYHQRQLVNVNNRDQGAKKLGWTANKLARVEKGTYDLSLTDLQDIAAYIKRPLWELMKEVEDGGNQTRTTNVLDASEPVQACGV